MAEDIARYSVQHWLESAAQGYLLGHEYGHLAGEREPAWLLGSEPLRRRAIHVTAELLAAERCSLEISAMLVRMVPDDDARRFLATQVIDEARHVEIFGQRLVDLGVAPREIDAVVGGATSPNLARFAELLHALAAERRFELTVIGHNLLLEAVMLAIGELLLASQREHNPKFARTLAGTLLDEQRHAGGAEHLVRRRLRADPALGARARVLQRELTHWGLAAFADVVRAASLDAAASRDNARPLGRAETEAFLIRSLEEDLAVRMSRIGLDYQPPVRS